MTDIERRIREVLEEEARLAPTPHEARPAIRRTRRRQSLVVVVSALGVAAALAVGALGFGALTRTDEKVVGSQPTVTQTMNGITITIPRDWILIDPDRAGLNGPEEPVRSLPRLILMVAPQPLGKALGCPGRASDVPPFLLSVQEHALALTGPASAAWPVEPEPFGAMADWMWFERDSGESACYPGWEFQRAAWTAGGRTFDARIGISPDASEAERAALAEAYASMRFPAGTDEPTSVVLTTGSAGGEDWELLATRQSDGLSLSLQGETFGMGTGGYGAPDELRLSSHVFGSGADGELLVFGAVPANVVRVEALTGAGGPAVTVDVLDVPEAIEGRLNAFVVVLPVDSVVVKAYDQAGNIVLRGTVQGSDGGSTQ